MDFEKRKEIMQKAFKVGGPLHTDIICLQECNLGPSVGKENDEYAALKTFLETKENGYSVIDGKSTPQNKNLSKQTNHGQSTAIAYKKDIFIADNSYAFQPLIADKQLDTARKTLSEGKLLTTVRLTPNNITNTPSIKIISLHNPDYGKLDYIKALILGETFNNKNIKGHTATEGFTICAGDFNYDTLGSQISTYNSLKEIFDKYNNAALDHKLENKATARGAQGYAELIDYIFYTPNLPPVKKDWQLSCTSFSIYPNNPQQLLSHNFTKNWDSDKQTSEWTDSTYIKHLSSQQYYFSDHSAMVAQFKLIDVKEEELKEQALTQLGSALSSLKI